MKTFFRHLRKLPWYAIAMPASALVFLFWAHAHSADLEAWLRPQTFGAELTPHVESAFQAAFWLAWAWLLDGALHVFLWEGMSRRLKRKAAPSFLRKTVTTVIFALALAGIAIRVFHQPLTGLGLTSATFGLAIGFAQKKLIGDFFSGIAMSVDPSFRLGDWIMVRLPGEDTIYGQVVEMDWRLTWLESRSRTKRIAIPYSLLISSSVTTLYKPLPRQRFEAQLSLEESIPVDRAIRILDAATIGIPGILDDPRPQAVVHDIGLGGIVYSIRYWIGPEVSMEIARHSILAAALTALRKADIATAKAKQDLFLGRYRELPEDAHLSAADLIAEVAIFEGLSAEESEELSGHAQVRHVRAGQPVIQAGEPGSSMYILCEGVLEVLLDDGSGGSVHAAWLRPGDFFGEMSLLTGDPRSATVVANMDAVLYEIGRDALERLLTRNPRIAEEICRIVDDRRAGNAETLDSHAAAARASGWLKGRLIGRMKKFFKMH